MTPRKPEISFIVLCGLLAACSKRPPPKPAEELPAPQEVVANANANTPESFIAEGFFTQTDLDDIGMFESKSVAKRMAIDSAAEAFRSQLAAEVAAQALGPGSCVRFGKTAEPARIKVLSPGVEPRNTLRYALAPDQQGTVAVVLQVALQSPNDGFCSMPVVRIELRYRTAKARDGSAEVRFETNRLFVFRFGDPHIHEAVANTLAGFSIQGQLRVSPTGLLCGSTYEASERAVSLAPALVNELVETLARFIVPVPESPVGPGASWQVVEGLESGVTRRTVYTLSTASAESFEVLASSFAAGAQHPPREPWPFDIMFSVRLVEGEDLGAPGYQETERGSLRIALHELSREMMLHKQSLFLEGTDVVRVTDTNTQLRPSIEGFDAYALPSASKRPAYAQ